MFEQKEKIKSEKNGYARIKYITQISIIINKVFKISLFTRIISLKLFIYKIQIVYNLSVVQKKNYYVTPMTSRIK